MGPDDYFNYGNKWIFKYCDYGDYLINPYDKHWIFKEPEVEKEIPYQEDIKKLENILCEVLTEFTGCGIKLYPYSTSTVIIEKIIIEGKDKSIMITYDPITHEVSGFIQISLGERTFSEITEEESKKIKRELLIWIYNNI